MASEGLLAIDRVASFDPESLRLLGRVGTCAKDLLAACLALPPDAQRSLMECRAFLFRRWVLEVVLVTRFRGPIGYGGIARALGGLPSGSLSPKLRELTTAGVLLREETGDDVGSVRYAPSPGGARLANGVYALTVSHAYQHVAIGSGKRAPEISGGFSFAREGPPPAFEDARDAYAEAARAFAEHHVAWQSPPRFESSFETAARFTEACDRKWQGRVMMALFGGPQTYADLRRGLDIGDQALALALRELQTLSVVERGEDDAYSIAPFGVFNFAFGMGALALLHEIQSSKPSTYQP